LDEVYPLIVGDLLAQQADIPSRLGTVADLGLASITLAPGALKLLGHSGRALNPYLALVEACWVLSGQNSVVPLATVVRSYRQFSDDGEILAGAYGERLRSRFGFDQLSQAVSALQRDPDSRRSFTLIAEPRDCGSDLRDVPCNIALMFRLLAGRVEMTVVNRSNDVIFGLPYDIFVFSLIHYWAARQLGAELGSHHHLTNSLHLYAGNRDIAERITSNRGTIALPTGASAMSFMNDLIDDCAEIGRLDAPAIKSGRLRNFFMGFLNCEDADQPPADAQGGDWLDAMARQWSNRPRSSNVAHLPAVPRK
jgi:hypothetical protein